MTTTTFQSQMEKRTHIKATEPLKERLDKVYERVLKSLRDFNEAFDQRSQFNTDEEYNEAMYVIANHIYLIYERLHLNTVREINYSDIRHFAINNNKFIKYIFKKDFPEFSIDTLDKWTQIHIDMLECAMYRSNNKYNKHIFH